MFRLKTILVPVTDSDSPLLEQIAWLARRFQSEVILLRAGAAFDDPVGITPQHIPALTGITVTHIQVSGAVADQILQVALDRDAGLIVIPAPGRLSLLTKKLLRESPCSVWMGGHLESVPGEFAVRHILCPVELKGHSLHTVAQALAIAEGMGARLSLIHITESVTVWGPGGSILDPELQKTLLGIANEGIAGLQQKLGTHLDVIIESGNAAELLNEAAERIHADLMILGRIPGRSHLGKNGEGIGMIRKSRIPVLSV